jgi:hypothetical protein
MVLSVFLIKRLLHFFNAVLNYLKPTWLMGLLFYRNVKLMTIDMGKSLHKNHCWLSLIGRTTFYSIIYLSSIYKLDKIISE